MTEKQLETLEAMFPDGFVLVAKQPNGNVQTLKHNPKGFVGFELLNDTVWALADSIGENLGGLQRRRAEGERPTGGGVAG